MMDHAGKLKGINYLWIQKFLSVNKLLLITSKYEFKGEIKYPSILHVNYCVPESF